MCDLAGSNWIEKDLFGVTPGIVLGGKKKG